MFDTIVKDVASELDKSIPAVLDFHYLSPLSTESFSVHVKRRTWYASKVAVADVKYEIRQWGFKDFFFVSERRSHPNTSTKILSGYLFKRGSDGSLMPMALSPYRFYESAYYMVEVKELI